MKNLIFIIALVLMFVIGFMLIDRKRDLNIERHEHATPKL